MHNKQEVQSAESAKTIKRVTWGGTAVILQAGDTACEAVVDWHGSMVSLSVSGGSGARPLLQALLDGME